MSLVNICMIAKDRPRLTAQALQSLQKNTPRGLYNLTFIDDGSDSWDSDSRELPYSDEDWLFVRLSHSKGIVGFVRNLSIHIAEQHWGRGDFLYLSDSDLFFMPGWLEKVVAELTSWERAWDGVPIRQGYERPLRLLGGVRHPYHGVNLRFVHPIMSEESHEERPSVCITDAVAGYSMLMRWETWDKYGPFDAHAQGVCQSEDFAFCQKVIKDGGLVGYIEPGVIVNCGLTNSEGKPAVGSEAFPRIEGIVQE